MNIDFKFIKEKYPNAWKILKNYFKLNDDSDDEIIRLINENGINICYCDLEKFFDDNGIIIEINTNSIYWYYYITYESDSYNGFNEKDFYKSRQEAKEQAIIKSFEILENKIKK